MAAEQTANAPGQPEDDSRRGFLKILGGLLTLGITAALGIPSVAYILAPLTGKKSTGPEPVPVGTVGTLAVDVPQRADVVANREDAWTREEGVRLGSVWLVKQKGGKVKCFSTVCPHLGCAIDYDEQKKHFICPCHTSIFGLDGKLVSGPSPRAMDSLDVEAKGEKVEVRYQRFRQGTPRREPV
jgi:menaquinol-cytochrome c reductase iron-sulfur subunit